jgi:hypothetical protein
MTRHYCSYFDSRYLARGLAMIRSLRRFDADARVSVLCLDDECARLLGVLQEPGVQPISLGVLEAGDAALAAAKANRSLIEYYFTLTPSLVSYVLARAADGETVTYLDGDLYFFDSPEPLHRELGTNSVALIAHRFPKALQHLEKHGRYNVGWLTFRNDENGRAAAAWWRERCNEWCYDVVEADRFADQKYLERFSSLFSGVVELQHRGANLAPWNLGGHSVVMSRDGVVVDASWPLIFFHFHGVKALASWIYLVRHHPYGASFQGIVRTKIYRPYVAALASIDAELQRLGRHSVGALKRDQSARRSLTSRATAGLRRLATNAAMLLHGEVVIVANGRCF